MLNVGTNMKRAALTVLFCVALTLSLTGNCNPQHNASALHNNAWNSIARRALNSSSDKYALYGSRTIAVSSPEMYLKADVQMLMWMKSHPKGVVVTGRPGRPAPVSLDLSWKMLQNLRTSSARELYPINAPFLDFVDRRLLPPTAVLRQLKVVDGHLTVSNHENITELSKAVLAYYFKQKEKNAHILYCSNESAFLLLKDKAISMKDLQMSVVDCDPILIFNKSHVWYPIMGRDDTLTEKSLYAAVKRYVKSDSIKLDANQLQLVKILKQATQISNSSERRMVQLVTLNTTPILYLDDNEKLKAENSGNLVEWQVALQDKNILDEFTIQRVHTGISSLVLQDIHIKSNQLSPMTAYMAAQVVGKRPKDAARTLSEVYSHYFRWGEVWRWGLTDFTIDESLSAGGGGVCVTHSNNIGAILDLANVDHYTVHTYNRDKNKDHRIVYVPSWKATFSNGILPKGGGRSIFDPPQFRSVVYLRYGGKWAFFAPPVFFGSLGGESVSSHLDFLVGEFNDTLEGVAISPQWMKNEMPTPISLNELLKYLTSARPTYFN